MLLTGGGALGNVLSAHLREGGFDVILTRRAGGGESVELDVTMADSVSTVIKSFQPDYVVHLAATFGSDFNESLVVNVGGAQNLLESVAKYAPNARVLLAGSAAEYGVVVPEENPVNENQPLRPVSVYGLTKSWQTSLGLMKARNGVSVVIARIFNLDGPGLSDRLFVGRVERQIAEIRCGERSQIEVGSLSAVRDYIPLVQASRQMLAILKKGISGEVYHVASGVPTLMRDFLRRRLEIEGLGFDRVIEHTDLGNRTGYDVPLIYADISKTMRLL